MKKNALLLALLLLAPLSRADVQVPSLFGDHMVLQQDAPLPVWGTADPNEKVTVTLGTISASATAGADGKWRVSLPPQPSTATPVTMTITGKNKLTFADVLIGEVWIASGQSNMVLPLAVTVHGADEIAQVNDPQLRLFQMNGKPGLQPVDQYALGKWVLATPASVGSFSGVGYYFAKALRASLKRPVGMVQNAVGGTIVEAWTPLEDLKNNPDAAAFVDKYNQILAAFPKANAEYPAIFDAWHKARIEWQKEVGPTYEPLMTAWRAEAAKDNAAGIHPPPQPVPSRQPPPPPPVPYGGQNTPTVLFNGRVAPLIPYAIRGAIWYQGESNAMTDPALYHSTLPPMITAWRREWGQGDFPFLIVQLPNLAGGPHWPQVREAQAQAAATLPQVALAITIDAGDANNLHPINKRPVGERLALVARHVAYKEKDIVWTGPAYDSMKVEGNAVRITFTQTGGGLAIGKAPLVPPGSRPIPTDSLLGFAIAGADQKWVAANAKIDGDSVLVSSSAVPNPAAVRYAWQNAPRCNLYNKEGLPAAPLRTDNWPNVEDSPFVPPAAAPKPPPVSPTAPSVSPGGPQASPAAAK